MIEQDDSDSIILAATNHPEILDYALFRRFDDVVEYNLPDKQSITKLFKIKLSAFKTSRMVWKTLAEKAFGISCADICKIRFKLFVTDFLALGKSFFKSQRLTDFDVLLDHNREIVSGNPLSFFGPVVIFLFLFQDFIGG